MTVTSFPLHPLMPCTSGCSEFPITTMCAPCALCSWAILWIFWLQVGVFQWQSVLLTFIVGGVCLRYGQSYLGAGDTLLMLSWSGGLSLEELLQILFLASLFGISVFSVYFICHKKKMEKLPFIPFLSSALLIVLHLRY